MNIEEIKMDHFENFEELIKTCKMWIRDDDIDAYYRFFEFNCMKALVTAYEKEKEKNKEQYKEFIKEHGEVCEKLKEDINKEWKDKIKAKIEELEKGNKNTFIRGEKILVLQSLLEKE